MLVYTQLPVLNVNGQKGTSVNKPHTNGDVHGRIVDHPNFMRKVVNQVKTLPRIVMKYFTLHDYNFYSDFCPPLLTHRCISCSCSSICMSKGEPAHVVAEWHLHRK